MPDLQAAHADSLSPRSKAIVEAVASGKSRRDAAKEFGVSHQRVTQIIHAPSGAAYLATLGDQGRARIRGKVLAEIEHRLEYGGTAVPLKDLIRLFQVLEPQVVNVTGDAEFVAAAERLAARTGRDKAALLAELRERTAAIERERKGRKVG